MTQRRPAWRLLHRTLFTLRADRRGAIFVMTALLMPIMVGIIGLGVEVGLWFQEK